jgi:hypothetical protein
MTTEAKTSIKPIGSTHYSRYNIGDYVAVRNLEFKGVITCIHFTSGIEAHYTIDNGIQERRYGERLLDGVRYHQQKVRRSNGDK